MIRPTSGEASQFSLKLNVSQFSLYLSHLSLSLTAFCLTCSFSTINRRPYWYGRLYYCLVRRYLESVVVPLSRSQTSLRHPIFCDSKIIFCHNSYNKRRRAKNAKKNNKKIVKYSWKREMKVVELSSLVFS